MIRSNNINRQHRRVESCTSLLRLNMTRLALFVLFFIVCGAHSAAPPTPTTTASFELNSFLSAILDSPSTPSSRSSAPEQQFLSGDNTKGRDTLTGKHQNVYRGVRIADRGKVDEALTEIQRKTVKEKKHHQNRSSASDETASHDEQ